MNKISDNLQYGIPEAMKTDKITVFLGGTCYDNNWREELKNKFSDRIFFLDPYTEDWRPENIYNELAGMVVADYIVFYKGGDGSKREKQFLYNIGAEGKYSEFDDLNNLQAYLAKLTKPVTGPSASLRKLAGLLMIGRSSD